jgi:hypothetical protein
MAQENVSMEENQGEQTMEHCDAELDAFGDLPGARDAQLGGFFGRPVLIYETDWANNANIFDAIDPWYLFFSNPRVANRLTNFKLIRCNLKVKVVINGNSFYQGRLMVNYNPFEQADQYLRNGSDMIDNVRLYQRQHILCDPAQSTGGEMLLPFVWHKDYIDVVNSSIEFQQIGSLFIRTLCPLILSSDATNPAPVSVSIYAWAENMTLGGLTDTDILSMSPQSGPDEYGGTLSRTLATVAKLASPLTAMPFIGTYARATEIAAGSASAIAKLFGFSKPNNVEDPNRMQPRPISSLATVTGNDCALKLTLDPKQEVSVDPRLWDCHGMDCLSINAIAGIDSLYTKFYWAGLNDSGTRLFTTLVDPCVCYQDTLGHFAVPACCGVAMPFEFWSGSLEYTFEIVASAYHRGRIAIVYDPTETPTGYSANTTYQFVIDISENRKFSIKVGGSQPEALRSHYVPGNDADATLTNPSWPATNVGGWAITQAITRNSILQSGEIGNGTLTAFVINRLTNPGSIDTGVEVLVSVRACDDFRVYVPNDRLNKIIPINRHVDLEAVRPMSGLEPIPSGSLDTWDKYDVSVKGSMAEAPNIYIGEQIHSFRSLMKRYVHYITLNNAGDGVVVPRGSLIRFVHGMYPLPFMDSATYSSAFNVHYSTSSLGAENINYVGNNILNYLRPAFVVLRGSSRWKLVPNLPTLTASGELNCDLRVTRVRGSTYQAPTPVSLDVGDDALPRSGVIVNSNTLNGAALTVSRVNSALEFEVPFYTNYRFIPSFGYSETKSSTLTEGFELLGDPSALGSRFNLYYAGGEDLALGYFAGFPIMYAFDTPPPA